MITPIVRASNSSSMSNLSNVSGKQAKVADLHGSIADSVEELAMARSKFQEKDKGTVTRERSRFLMSNPDMLDAVNEVLDADQKPTQDSITQLLTKMKDDVSRYQLLKFLLESGDVDAAVYQFINDELEKLKRKRRKLASLDNISAETQEFAATEDMDGISLQNIYLGFLEFEGEMSLYFESLFKSSKKYKKLAKFMSKMINYDIFGLTPSDDLDVYIHLNERRKALNLLTDIYVYLDTEEFRGKWFIEDKQYEGKNNNDQNNSSGGQQQNASEQNKDENDPDEKKYDEDLLFISSILMNTDVEEICERMAADKVNMLISYFNKVHVDLFYSIDDKIEALDAMKNSITDRFTRHGVK